MRTITFIIDGKRVTVQYSSRKFNYAQLKEQAERLAKA